MIDGFVIDSAEKANMPVALLQQIEQKIIQNLNYLSFVFPGSTELFVSNPVFNNEGDLILGLQYK